MPEVLNFHPPQFTYNFFTTDEASNETGDIPESLKLKPTAFFDDSSNVITFAKHLPRYVTIQFNPVILETDPDYVARQPNDVGLIRSNLDKIVVEDNFSNDTFKGVMFQPIDFDMKLFNLVSGTAAASVPALSKPAFLPPGSTLAAAGEKVAGITSDSLPPSFLSRAMAKANIEGYSVKAHEDDAHEGLGLRIQFDTRIVSDAISTSLFDPLSTYNEDIRTLWESLRPVQAKSIARSKSNILHHKEYDTEVRYLSVEYGDESMFSDKRTTRIVGYIIDKWEVQSGGTFRNVLPPIVIESPKASSYVDFRVKYGTEYVYAVRAIALVKYVMPIERSDGTVETALVTLLISSRPTPKQYVKTFENVPPPPPVDIDFIWNYEDHTMGMIWSLPVNTQQDIKKFQVFRRPSINDPFELLKLFDFNDSEFVYQDPENDGVTDERRVKLTNGSPVTFFVDEDFKRDSTFIYAVASVDAHGLTSGYSQQFIVSYDKFKNRIIKKLISPSGAPKPYPNFYLTLDTFADVMVSSQKPTLDVYFTPDALDVVNRSNESTRVVQTDSSSGYYQVQIINTDVQKQHSIRVNISDRRPKVYTRAISDFISAIGTGLSTARDRKLR